MKKLFSCFAFLFACACCICFFGCDQQWHWHEAQDPTCERGGNIGYYTRDDSNEYFDRYKMRIDASEVFLDPIGHNWGEATYVWAVDNSTCTAIRVCENDPAHIETEMVDASAEVVQEQTCDNPELTTYTAIFTNVEYGFETQIKANIQTKAALGHNWGEVAYVWAVDNSTCTATRVCQENSDHIETETINATAEIIQEQTCEDVELTTYTATFTNPAFATQTRANIQTQAALGHSWGEVIYEWSADNSTCTARRVCVHDSNHVQTETVETSSEVTQSQTCEDPELTTYTAIFENDAFATQTKEGVQTKAACGHNWGAATYEWSNDNSTCTATRVCQNDIVHIETEIANATSVITQAQTCEDPELTRYTAIFENEAFATQTKEDIQTQAASGHNWGVATYVWAEDNSTCTATRVCQNNPAHTETETVDTTSVITQTQTCENAELRIYTATFTNEAFATQTKEDVQTQAALGHDWGAATYEWAVDNSTCTARRVCGNNGEHVQTETVNATAAITQAQTCENAELTTYTATFTNEAFATQTKPNVQTKAALGHDWGVATYVWAEDNSTCTARRVCGNNGEHVQTETVNTSSEVTQEQSCEDAELTTYTATFENEAFATQTKEDVQTKAALGHNWDVATYVWAGDNSTCTATRVCQNNPAHTETEIANATSVITQTQTCENAELRTYTATFINAAFATQIKSNIQTQAAIAGEHNYVYDEVKEKYVCSKCGEEQDSTDVSLLSINGTKLTGVDENFEGELFVPYGITEIGDYALQDNTKITAVYFPASLTKIGKYAFANCVNMRNFVLPEGLQTIDARAFTRNTNNAMTSLVIPNSVETIGKYAFYGLKWNLENAEPSDENDNVPTMEVVLSNSLTVIESGVFGKAKITSVDFNGANITKIKNESFHYNHLTSINLPASLISIYDHAFNGNHMSSINVSDTQVNDIGLGAFDDQTDAITGDPIQIYNVWEGGYYLGKGENSHYFLVTWDYNVNNEGAEDGALIHADTKCVASELLNLTLSENSSYDIDGQYEIKQTVGNITFVSYAYRSSKDDGKFCLKRIDVVGGTSKSEITTIEFPSYLADYKYGVLIGYDHLEELTTTVGFGRLGNFFCDHAVNLDSENHNAIVPTSLQVVNVIGGRYCSEIEEKSFQGLSYVETVNIGPKITTIARKAFYGCTGLTSVTVNNNASFTIGVSAFEGCANLQEFTYNTDYSVSFGNDCFWNTALTSFVISSGSTMGTTMLGSCASLRYVFIASDTTITLNESGNSPFTKCRELPADSTSNIILTIYTDGNVAGDNWCENWSDTSHSSDPKVDDQRVRKPATVVYNTTLEAFNEILANA